MSKVNVKIIREIERIVLNSTKKREMLLQNALSRSKMKRRLTISSGILALFSAGAITTVIVKYYGNETLQIIAAITATISGFLSMTITIYYAEEVTSKIFEGSSKYLSLRDKAYRLLIHPNSSIEQTYSDLANLQTEYAQLDESFSKYTRFKKTFLAKRRERRFKRNLQNEQEGPVFMINPRKNFSVQRARVQKVLDNEEENFKREVALLKKGEKEK